MSEDKVISELLNKHFVSSDYEMTTNMRKQLEKMGMLAGATTQMEEILGSEVSSRADFYDVKIEGSDNSLLTISGYFFNYEEIRTFEEAIREDERKRNSKH